MRSLTLPLSSKLSRPNLLPARAPAASKQASRPVDTFERATRSFGALFGHPAAPATGSAANIGWMQRQLAPTTDATGDFTSLYAQAQAGKDTLPAEARDYVYVTVQGLMGKHYVRYMDPNEERLRSLGLTVERAPIDTDAGVEQNAEVIAQMIRDAAAQGKKVVLVGHSKGGLDATAALSLHPELAESVRAVVTLQSPYGGTPIATDLEASPFAAAANGVFDGLLHGDSAALKDMTYAARQAFLAAHPYPGSVPTVSLGSSSQAVFSTVAGSGAYLRSTYGVANDGLVAEPDAFVPGSRTVTLDGLDHAGPAMDHLMSVESKWDPGSLTQAMVSLALQR